MAWLRRMNLLNYRELMTYADYHEFMPESRIPELQLRKLNDAWAQARENAPYYAELAKNRALPAEFSSLKEFAEKMPILNRADLNERGEQMFDRSHGFKFYRSTGGSTAQPIRLPAWKSEKIYHQLDEFYCSHLCGIHPRDPVFLLTGHRQTLGNGIRKVKNLGLRWIKDRMLNYRRHSAYDLSEKQMLIAGKKLRKQKPACFIGYGYAIDRFARVHQEHGVNFKDLDLKAVFYSAEMLPFSDSQEVIQAVLGAPVVSRYGAIECNWIAQSTPDGLYRVLWNNSLIEAVELNGRTELLVTSLYPRAAPLFRYRLGDCIDAGGRSRIIDGVSLVDFEEILGRSNRPILLPDGTPIHTESAVNHVFCDLSNSIQGYQLVCAKEDLLVKIVPGNPVTDEFKREIIYKLDSLHSGTKGKIRVEAVPELQESTAGKHPIVIYESGMSFSSRDY